MSPQGARPDGLGARLVRRFAERTIDRSLRDGLRRRRGHRPHR